MLGFCGRLAANEKKGMPMKPSPRTAYVAIIPLLWAGWSMAQEPPQPEQQGIETETTTNQEQTNDPEPVIVGPGGRIAPESGGDEPALLICTKN